LHQVTLIHEIIWCARMFSKQLGHNFTSKTTLISAVSGEAALCLGAHTTHRECKLNSKEPLTAEDFDKCSDARLHMIDGVSQVGRETLSKLDEKLRNLTQHQDHLCGKHPIVLIGDFRQIQPPHPVCDGKKFSLLWEGTLNCMVELKGACKHTMAMKDLMLHWRENDISQEQRDLLNARVVGTTDGNDCSLQLPNAFETRWATASLRDACFVNASLFKHCLTTFHSRNNTNIQKSTIVTCAAAKWENANGAKLSDCEHKTLFEHCTSCSCRNKNRQHCDPLLCLCCDCHVTSTCNGSTALVKKVNLKPGAKLTPMKMHGRWVNSVSAENVLSAEASSDDTGQERILSIKPKPGSFTVNFPQCVQDTSAEKVKTIHMLQVPMMNSLATSGSRLAGKSLKWPNLVPTEWCHGIKNWEHSAISTVSNLNNLCLREPLPNHEHCAPDFAHLQMMGEFRRTILAKPADVQSLTFPLCGFPKSKRKGSCTPNQPHPDKKHRTAN